MAAGVNALERFINVFGASGLNGREKSEAIDQTGLPPEQKAELEAKSPLSVAAKIAEISADAFRDISAESSVKLPNDRVYDFKRRITKNDFKGLFVDTIKAGQAQYALGDRRNNPYKHGILNVCGLELRPSVYPPADENSPPEPREDEVVMAAKLKEYISKAGLTSIEVPEKKLYAGAGKVVVVETDIASITQERSKENFRGFDAETKEKLARELVQLAVTTGLPSIQWEYVRFTEDGKVRIYNTDAYQILFEDHDPEREDISEYSLASLRQIIRDFGYGRGEAEYCAPIFAVLARRAISDIVEMGMQTPLGYSKALTSLKMLKSDFSDDGTFKAGTQRVSIAETIVTVLRGWNMAKGELPKDKEALIKVLLREYVPHDQVQAVFDELQRESALKQQRGVSPPPLYTNAQLVQKLMTKKRHDCEEKRNIAELALEIYDRGGDAWENSWTLFAHNADFAGGWEAIKEVIESGKSREEKLQTVNFQKRWLQLSPYFREHMAYTVWHAYRRVAGDPYAFGNKGIQDRPRVLIDCRNANGQTIIDQMIEFCEAKMAAAKARTTLDEVFAAIQAGKLDVAKRKLGRVQEPFKTAFANLEINTLPQVVRLKKVVNIFERNLSLSNAQDGLDRAVKPHPDVHEDVEVTPAKFPYLPPVGIKVAMVTYEVKGWGIGHGGLGEASQGITQGLADKGYHVSVIMPNFGTPEGTNGNVTTVNINDPTTADGQFDMSCGLYGGDDLIAKVMRFGKGIHEHFKTHQYDVAILNDWHAGAVFSYVDLREYVESFPPTVSIVHNGSFGCHGGITNKELLRDLQVARHNLVGTQVFGTQAALSDYRSAVSLAYAQEMQQDIFGDGMQDVNKLSAQEGRLVGITNGLYREAWDAATVGGLKNWPVLVKNADGTIAETGARRDLNFDPAEDVLAQKDYAREQASLWFQKYHPEVLAEYGDFLDGQPIVFYVGRYDPEQKGIELFERAMVEASKRGAHFVAFGFYENAKGREIIKRAQARAKDLHDNPVGTGRAFILNDKVYQDDDPAGTVLQKYTFQMGEKDRGIPGVGALMRMASTIGFAGSKFEPCGLVQFEAWKMLIGLFVATRTGGLADTVGGDNGVTFERKADFDSPEQGDVMADALNETIDRWNGMTDDRKRDVIVKNYEHACQVGWTTSPNGELPPIDRYEYLMGQAIVEKEQRVYKTVDGFVTA